MRYFVFILLAGCAQQATSQYRWAGGHPSTLDRDLATCEQQTLSVPFISNERGVAIFGACMRARGWHLVQI